MFIFRIQAGRAFTTSRRAYVLLLTAREQIARNTVQPCGHRYFSLFEATEQLRPFNFQVAAKPPSNLYKIPMADGEEERITQVVNDFLKTADMNVTTERIVLTHVQDALPLSKPISEYKLHISSVIEKFLEELDAQAQAQASGDEGGGGGGSSDREYDSEGEPGPAKAKRGRKRAGEDGATGTGTAAKRSRASTGTSTGADEVVFSTDLSGRRKVRVRKWAGKLHVDVREFYQAEGGEAPSQKGLSMDLGQWARLARDLPQLLAAQRAGNGGAPACQLSRTRLAAVSEFRGTYYLGLREHFEKEGQLQPSKKGINLSLAEAEALLAAAPDIAAAAAGVAELLPPPSTSPLEAVVLPPGGAAAAACGGSSSDGGGAARPQDVVELGGLKRLSISKYGGRVSVDLREFYERNGEMLPGKKGIALSPGDWSTLQHHLEEVDTALKQRDLGYCLKLSGMRRVSLSEFKGVIYVGVREYYDKGGGELAPSAKGLNLNPVQWAAFVAGAPAIATALQRAQQGG